MHPRVADRFDLPQRAYLAELNVDAVMDAAGTLAPNLELSRFPAVERDIAFLVPLSQPAERVCAVIAVTAGAYLESVELFNVYQGASIPAGWRSLAYRLTFRAADRTLSDSEVDAAMEAVRRALVDEIGATLR